MVEINELFFLLLSCVASGTDTNYRDKCTTTHMNEVPYIKNSLDKNLPSFDEGHLYSFKTTNSIPAKLEILIKNGKILQAGIEIVYPKESKQYSTKHFKSVATIANKHYGKGTKIDMGGVDNLNYGNRKSVFYIINSVANKHNFIVFRAGNRIFW